MYSDFFYCGYQTNTMKSVLFFWFNVVAFAIGLFYILPIFNFEYIPEVSDNDHWGNHEMSKNDSKIHVFDLKVETKEIDDLLTRLNNIRGFTPSLKETQTQYGLNKHVVNVLINFVKENYNFTERLSYLNQFPQYTTKIQGLNIHFVHIKSKNKGKVPTVPILLLHGWPSSVREFYESIALFKSEEYQNEISYELVIPSLIGFGYSDGPIKPGFRLVHAANIMKLLMNRLGYKRFVVHGSDWGALTITALATLYPDSVIGFHSNFCISLRTITLTKTFIGSLWPSTVIDEKYRKNMYPLIGGFMRFLMAEAGYFHLMGTKPDTIGHILDNDPVGLITYMFEKLSVGKDKFNIYSDTAGLELFDLTTVMDSILFYYWFPHKATTAARFYSENVSVEGLLAGLHNIPISSNVACGCAFFENEFVYQPESFLRDKYRNLIQYNIYPAAGHFAAIEANEVLTKDIIYFVKKLHESNLL